MLLLEAGGWVEGGIWQVGAASPEASLHPQSSHQSQARGSWTEVLFKHPRLGRQAEEHGAGPGSRAKQDVRSLAGAQMPGPEEGEP